LDTEFAAIRDRERFKRLGQQVQDMLVSVDHKQLVKELDYKYEYSTQEKLEIVRILYKIRRSSLYDKKKLQKVINHYAIEDNDMFILRP
jgi:hypothetical protein